MKITNKGVSAWKIGKKKWRATLSVKNKEINIGYFNDFLEAVFAYIKAYIKAYNQLPNTKYVCPTTGLLLLDFSNSGVQNA